MAPYQYQQLKHEDSIRILILQPNVDDATPVRCSLKDVRLCEPKLDYEAVSYTWGDVVETEAIILSSSTELLVGKNCHNALRRLRLKHLDRWLWIDAVCINQLDLKERSRQVRLMDKVFRSSSRVMVYLGQQITQCEALFEELRAAEEEMRLTNTCDRSPPPKDSLIVEQLRLLFELLWFKRVWVLSEVYVPNPVIFMYGSESVSAQILFHLVCDYDWDKMRRLISAPLPLNLTLYPASFYEKPQITLWGLLGETREFRATDPKDKIFALRSLVISSQRSQIDHLVDYLQSVEECFEKVATFLLPVLGLRVLQAARHPHERDMPSWVPDWSQKSPLYIDISIFKFFSMEDKLIHSGCYSFANYEKPDRNRGTQTGVELCVQGCRYARIVEVGGVIDVGDVKECTKRTREMSGIIQATRQIEKEQVMLFIDSICDHLEPGISTALSRLSANELVSFLSRGSISVPFPDQKRFEQRVAEGFMNSLQQCRIILLDNGDLATAPAGVEVGDVVCLIVGAKAPCVLRHNPDLSWSLISGDCYLSSGNSQPYDDIMGETSAEMYIEDNNIDIEEFRLR